MKAVAAVVMVVGLTLMSAPFVLPQLGVDVAKVLGSTAATPKGTQTPVGVKGSGGVAAVGGAVNEWIGTVGSFLGRGTPASAAPSPADAAKEFAAVCGALSGGGAGCSGKSGGDFAEIFAKTVGMITSGEMPEAAAVVVPAQPAAAQTSQVKVPSVSIIETQTGRKRDTGAKFVKARGAGDAGGTP